MKELKLLFIELIPAVLCAVIAGMGAYIAVREDITKLTVNQETMLQEDREYREEMKYLYSEQHKQEVRIAIVEEKLK